MESKPGMIVVGKNKNIRRNIVKYTIRWKRMPRSKRVIKL